MPSMPIVPVKPPFEVPEPREIEEVQLPDGEAIVVRRHGNPEGPRLLTSHGNGLAIDMYYPFWGAWLGEFDVLVFDLRNHGWNRVGDVAKHHVPQFVQDLDHVAAAVRRRFGEKPTLGIYHSLSSLSVSLSASRGEGYAGLFLLDPPVCKPGRTYAEFEAALERRVRQLRRRAARFDSVEDYAELLRFMVFWRTVPGAVELAARSMLRPGDDGCGLVLRCPPEYEARLVEYLTAFAVLVEFETMRCPVKVLGADPTVPYSFLPSFDLGAIMECDYDFLPESSHLLFLEQPEVCARRVREFAVGCGLLSA